MSEFVSNRSEFPDAGGLELASTKHKQMKIHPDKNGNDLKRPKSRKRRYSNISDPADSIWNIDEVDFTAIISAEAEYSDACHSEGSNREAQDFSGESESDEEGNPIRQHVFPEADPTFNLFAPFHTLIDYRLACFFNSTKTSKAKINQFFKDNLLKGLNPIHQVQFRTAYSMYKLINAATDEPSWRSGIVNYPLLKGVDFYYRNIIEAVKYLLYQKVYANEMAWGPRQEYDKQGDHVYSEIHTAK
ncbi:hypothetical protein L211DRAFT_851742 [Terfezia boudieri ATCC MYA-4762]|uniref:Uncharacterized protein n=1 Tax=Terfezia boudieri ATCC MYA-4762 TaxID=1051890 RepID=A0A3N4LE37_9PEZI|nr:hypothetical protein L211DRAFT_851742 [Terfezia boudieri ATCC MYA-4762]